MDLTFLYSCHCHLLGETIVTNSAGEQEAIDTKKKLTLLSVKTPHGTNEFYIPPGGNRYCCVFFSRADTLTLWRDDPAILMGREKGFNSWDSSEDVLGFMHKYGITETEDDGCIPGIVFSDVGNWVM